MGSSETGAAAEPVGIEAGEDIVVVASTVVGGTATAASIVAVGTGSSWSTPGWGMGGAAALPGTHRWDTQRA